MPAGQIIYVNLEKHFGFIRSFDAGPNVWFKRQALIDIAFDRALDRHVRFDIFPGDKGTGLRSRHVWPE